jgi:CRP-like cAMP-binding protein
VQVYLTQSNVSESAKVAKKGAKRGAVIDAGRSPLMVTADYKPKFVEKSEDVKKMILSVVTTNILFSSYSTEEQMAIVDAFDSETCDADKEVIKQGEFGEFFYVVESGSLDVFIKSSDGTQKQGKRIGAESSFGELALMYNTPRAATIKANKPCTLWAIARSTFREIVCFYKLLRNREHQELLRNVEIAGNKLGSILSEVELEKMTMAMDKELFSQGESIIRQGNTGDDFYIIADGTVGVYKSENGGEPVRLVTLSKGAYFGELAILKEDVRQASCVAESDCICLTLGREDFNDLLGSFEDLLKDAKNQSKEPKADAGAVSLENSKSTGDSRDIKLEQLNIRATLGCGAFGRVKLASHTMDGCEPEYFALKCQSKKAIVDSGLQDHVLNEMRVLRRIEHPFIAKLHATLQDDKYIYFVLELLQGGELFTHLRNRGKLSEQTARFYAAAVVFCFSALHPRKIAYRDLKPENLVMNNEGYIKLVDFGLAKQLLTGKTWTLCGTPDYLAPEIILNEGHDLAVDYWALGVLIFEMVVGAPPFYAEDPMEVYEKILSGAPVVRSFFTRNLADLLKKLLRSQQAKRLGNTRGGTASVVKHKWFTSFDWVSLEQARLKAPFKPSVVSADDVGNFDAFDEGETPESSDWDPALE